MRRKYKFGYFGFIANMVYSSIYNRPLDSRLPRRQAGVRGNDNPPARRVPIAKNKTFDTD